MPGPMELMVIAALALIVFGPARLPEIARSIGKAVNEFRRQASDLKSEFDLQMDEEDDAVTAAAAKTSGDQPEKPAQDPDPAPDPATDAPGEVDPDPTVPTGAPDSATDKS